MKQLATLYLWVPLIASIGAFAEQLPVQVYTTADGLAHNHINCIHQDSRGFLWFCTDEGLTRFDGYRLISYTVRDGLPHPWINDLIETRDGALWIASDAGVSRLNPKRSSAAEPMFVTYVPDQHPDARRVNALAEDATGVIWCATYNGLYRLDRTGDHVKFQWVDIGTPSGTDEARLVNNVAVDRNGALWLTARTGLYRRLPDGRVERYTRRNGLPDDFTGALLDDRQGRWWVATRVGGFCLLTSAPEPDRRVVQRCYSTADALPHNDVRAVFQSTDGKIWIGTAGGLSHFTPDAPSGELFRTYTTANGLSELQIYKLAEDRDGNLWIGTRRSGVMKMGRPGFASYGEAEGFYPGTTHQDIFETRREELCVLTSNGQGSWMQRFDGRRFVTTRINLPQRFGAECFYGQHGFQDRAGEWWLATCQGLLHYPKTAQVEDLARAPPKVYTTTDGLPSDRIDQVYEDGRGVIWIATTYTPLQLTQWNRGDRMLRVYAVANADFPQAKSGWVTAMAEHAGDVWLGFRDFSGLVRNRNGRFERLFEGPSTIRGPINALHMDHSGRLWIASAQGGLYHVDDPAAAQPRLTRYTSAEGLSSNEILCLIEDQWGRIYAGTNRGVDRLDPTSGSIKHYTTADGLSRGAVALAFRDHLGMLWFVADKGISRLTPSPDPPPAAAPIRITGLRTMGVPLPISALGEVSVEGLKLSPNHNQLQIDFVGLDFRPGATLRYQYKLENADSDWSAPSTERTVNYATVAPGSYRFLVRALSSDGITSLRPAMVTFTILAPVWQSWWFITLATLALGSAVYALHRNRVGRLLELERIRNRIATDLHDDIGASLSHIALLSEVVSSEAARLDLPPDGRRLHEPLARIGSVSRELIDSMSDIVWAISPRKDRMRSLTQRIREFADEVLSTRNIEFELQSAGIDEQVKLDPEVRRQIFLIFKECVNNIVRHSESTRVVSDCRIEEGELVLQLRDNGRGFSSTATNGPENRGHGLLSMRRRAEALGGRLEVATALNQGVSVVLRVPLDHHASSFWSHIT